MPKAAPRFRPKHVRGRGDARLPSYLLVSTSALQSPKKSVIETGFNLYKEIETCYTYCTPASSQISRLMDNYKLLPVVLFKMDGWMLRSLFQSAFVCVRVG